MQNYTFFPKRANFSVKIFIYWGNLCNFAPRKHSITVEMKIKLVVLCMAVFLLASCKKTPVAPTPSSEEVPPVETTEPEEEELAEEEQLDELIAEEPMPVTVDELFDDFIFNFASNKRLQMERIDFPLVINSGAKKDTVQRDDWQMEHFFMHQGEYTLMFDSQEQMEHAKDTVLNEAVVEKIFLDDAFIRQYIFRRRGGRWMLCEIRNQTLPRNPNASFIDFYHHFVTDSAFQRESLSNEIDFVGPDPEDDFSQMEGVITPEFWDAFAPELPKRMLFNVVYGSQDSTANEKIFVLRGIANGLELELTFRRENERWRLVKLIE